MTLTLEPAAAEPALPTTTSLHGNSAVQQWVDEITALCRPDWIIWCDGSAAQNRTLAQQAIDGGVQHSQPLAGDALTYICTPDPEMVDPMLNWMDDQTAAATLKNLFDGCMTQRTMYVIPLLIEGPADKPRVSVEITDSLFTAVRLTTSNRAGSTAWEALGDSADFSRHIHSLGDARPAPRLVCHVPHTHTVWHYGTESSIED